MKVKAIRLKRKFFQVTEESLC